VGVSSDAWRLIAGLRKDGPGKAGDGSEQTDIHFPIVASFGPFVLQRGKGRLPESQIEGLKLSSRWQRNEFAWLS
jgi:hypothetical protein